MLDHYVMQKIDHKKAGFSLIELLFAMLFMSIIIFGVIRLQTSNLTLSNTQKLELRANFYATQALEVVSSLGYGAVSACTTPCYLQKSGNDYSLLSNGSENLENSLFERKIQHDQSGLTNASLVTVNVGWTDSSGDHSVSAKRVVK